ncbi:MAG: glycosyl transferase, partial [Proteobacteria bacterium]
MSAVQRWSDARRVLCVRLDQLGDLLMTTPALRALRALPAAPELVLLGSPAAARCAAHVPELDGAIEYAAPWMKATAAPDASADRALVERLRGERFDAAVVFTVYTQSALPAALLCLLAEIPLRLAHARENPYHLLTHWVPDPEPAAGVRHEVRRQLDLVAAIGAHAPDERLSLRVAPDARERVRSRLARCGVDPARRWLALHPGA